MMIMRIYLNNNNNNNNNNDDNYDIYPGILPPLCSLFLMSLSKLLQLLEA